MIQTSTANKVGTLQLDYIEAQVHLKEMTGRRSGGAYHYTELWAFGQDALGASVRVNLYDYLRHNWGLLSAKRLTALTQTQPLELTLAEDQLQPEFYDWVQRAKVWHAAAGTDWKQPARVLTEAQILLRLGTVWPEARNRRVTASESQPKLPSTTKRCAHCQLCDQKRPRAGMRGYGRDFKRICKRCWKALDL